MNDLTLFKNERFGDIRVFIKNEEFWFVAKDISATLDYRTSNDMTRLLDEDEKDTQIVRTPSGEQVMVVINESGLYSAILRSRKSEAKQFKKWVTSEVLPSIRKHGTYMTKDVIEKTLANPDFIIQLATQLKEEKQKRLLIEQQLEEQKPKVEMYDEFINSDTLMNFKQVADTLGYGRNTLMKELRQEKVLSDGNYNKNLPYSQYVKANLFKVKIVPRRTNNGVENICTTLCTSKAIEFIKRVLDKKKKSLQLELQA